MIKQSQIVIKVGKKRIKNATLFYFSKDILDTLGIARIEVPYSKEYEKIFAVGTKEIIIEGGTPNGRIFYGVSNSIRRVQDSLSITMQDYGSNFKKPCSTTYSDETLESVLKKLIKEVEFEAILTNISPDILSKKISQPTTLEAGTGGAMGGITGSGGATICGDYKISKGKGDGKWYHSCFANHCPNCNKSGTLEYGRAIGKHDIIVVCGRKEYSGGSPADARRGVWGIVEGHLFCCTSKGGCDADYCGVTGKDHGGRKSIVPLSQTVVASPNNSGGSGGASVTNIASSLIGSIFGGASSPTP
ncbi:MAG: hypothetical protein Q8M92_10560, partial [Candidatus Subteraquimicrobiales bacterium]|nr:hypothetical protein [Candidatus Subteraquimicrobiales bacterium]